MRSVPITELVAAQIVDHIGAGGSPWGIAVEL